MNLVAILAMLVQMGACAELQFEGQDGAHLHIVVCPMLTPPDADSPPATSDDPNKGPPNPGETDG